MIQAQTTSTKKGSLSGQSTKEAVEDVVPNPARPIEIDLHPVSTGDYRIGTPAIESFYELITRCLRYRIPGALTYGPSRTGKTKAIEYLRLLIAIKHPKITFFHVHAEHKPRHAEGAFFSNLLEAVGHPDPDGGTNSSKRTRLFAKIKEACCRNGSGVVLLFCDEAQRYDENEYEWLRDVHDRLGSMAIQMFTFLVGQEELLAVKTAMQQARKTQIVARLMVEEMAFHGVRDVQDVATCLSGYDRTHYPRSSDWSYTRFFMRRAVKEGYLLSNDATMLWDAFDLLHHGQGLAGELEIPMESFTRAVEIVFKESESLDCPGYRPSKGLWELAVKNSGYVQSRVALSPGIRG